MSVETILSLTGKHLDCQLHMVACLDRFTEVFYE